MAGVGRGWEAAGRRLHGGAVSSVRWGKRAVVMGFGDGCSVENEGAGGGVEFKEGDPMISACVLGWRSAEIAGGLVQCGDNGSR